MRPVINVRFALILKNISGYANNVRKEITSVYLYGMAMVNDNFIAALNIIHVKRLAKTEKGRMWHLHYMYDRL